MHGEKNLGGCDVGLQRRYTHAIGQAWGGWGSDLGATQKVEHTLLWDDIPKLWLQKAINMQAAVFLSSQIIKQDIAANMPAWYRWWVFGPAFALHTRGPRFRQLRTTLITLLKLRQLPQRRMAIDSTLEAM
jgi:hypothetical protein